MAQNVHHELQKAEELRIKNVFLHSSLVPKKYYLYRDNFDSSKEFIIERKKLNDEKRAGKDMSQKFNELITRNGVSDLYSSSFNQTKMSIGILEKGDDSMFLGKYESMTVSKSMSANVENEKSKKVVENEKSKKVFESITFLKMVKGAWINPKKV